MDESLVSELTEVLLRDHVGYHTRPGDSKDLHAEDLPCVHHMLDDLSSK